MNVLSHRMRLVWFGIPTSTKEATFLLAHPDIKQTGKEKGVVGIEICQLSNKH